MVAGEALAAVGGLAAAPFQRGAAGGGVGLRGGRLREPNLDVGDEGGRVGEPLLGLGAAVILGRRRGREILRLLSEGREPLVVVGDHRRLALAVAGDLAGAASKVRQAVADPSFLGLALGESLPEALERGAPLGGGVAEQRQTVGEDGLVARRGGLRGLASPRPETTAVNTRSASSAAASSSASRTQATAASILRISADRPR